MKLIKSAPQQGRKPIAHLRALWGAAASRALWRSDDDLARSGLAQAQYESSCRQLRQDLPVEAVLCREFRPDMVHDLAGTVHLVPDRDYRAGRRVFRNQAALCRPTKHDLAGAEIVHDPTATTPTCPFCVDIAEWIIYECLSGSPAPCRPRRDRT